MENMQLLKQEVKADAFVTEDCEPEQHCMADEVDMGSWDIANVLKWLIDQDMSVFLDNFQKNHVNGRMLVNMDKAMLESINIKDPLEQEAMMSAIKTYVASQAKPWTLKKTIGLWDYYLENCEEKLEILETMSQMLRDRTSRIELAVMIFSTIIATLSVLTMAGGEDESSQDRNEKVNYVVAGLSFLSTILAGATKLLGWKEDMNRAYEISVKGRSFKEAMRKHTVQKETLYETIQMELMDFSAELTKVFTELSAERFEYLLWQEYTCCCGCFNTLSEAEMNQIKELGPDKHVHDYFNFKRDYGLNVTHTRRMQAMCLDDYLRGLLQQAFPEDEVWTKSHQEHAQSILRDIKNNKPKSFISCCLCCKKKEKENPGFSRLKELATV